MSKHPKSPCLPHGVGLQPEQDVICLLASMESGLYLRPITIKYTGEQMNKSDLQRLQHLVEGGPVRASAIPGREVNWRDEVSEVHVCRQHIVLLSPSQILRIQLQALCRSGSLVNSMPCTLLLSNNTDYALCNAA